MDCQRHLFSLPEDEHYLNCAQNGPLSRATEAAGLVGLKRKNRPTSILPADFFSLPAALRAEVAALLNVPAERVALIPAVSYGMAIAANNIPLSPGDEVLIPGEEFPSNVYPWRERAKTSGATVRMVPRPDTPFDLAKEWSARLLEAIGPRTRILALSTVHWTDGTPFDLTALCSRAREQGAYILIDGTQSIGAMPFDWNAFTPDLVVCGGYKWLLGPYQLGFAVVGERLMQGRPLENSWLTREGSEDFSALIHYRDGLQPGARRFDVGETSNWITVPMLTESIRQIRGWGVKSISDYCGALVAGLRDTLGDSKSAGFALPTPGNHAPHLFGVRLTGGADPKRVAESLRARKVHVSIRGAAVRVSPNVYNTPEDMNALAQALKAACT
ncbi:MAG: aminotransferase class V-fold PLP-dependent enzyme [Deltaproteobacteria bacterium]|nr:aminotransferase class V-fold PLP-dependent enzyme [Deltaproteobacteria bacterium]